MLAALGAGLGAAVGLGVGLPVAVTIALATGGALLGGLTGAIAALAVPSPTSAAQLAVDGLTSGQSVPDAPGLAPLRSLQDQVVAELTLGEIAAGYDLATLPTPAVVVIGAVIEMRENLDWYLDSIRENPIG